MAWRRRRRGGGDDWERQERKEEAQRRRRERAEDRRDAKRAKKEEKKEIERERKAEERARKKREVEAKKKAEREKRENAKAKKQAVRKEKQEARKLDLARKRAMERNRITELVAVARSILGAGKLPSDLHQVPPDVFEALIAEAYRRLGWKKVKLTGRTGDGGVDITANRDGHRYVIQCKRYKPSTNLVGRPEMRDFIGVTKIENARGVFVTTSRFLPAARKIAIASGIELVDGEALIPLLESVVQVAPRRGQSAARDSPTDEGEFEQLDLLDSARPERDELVSASGQVRGPFEEIPLPDFDYEIGKPFFVKMRYHFHQAGLSSKEFAAAFKTLLMDTFGLSEADALIEGKRFFSDLRSNNVPSIEEAEAEIQRIEAQVEAEGARKEPAGARPMEGQSFRSLREALSSELPTVPSRVPTGVPLPDFEYKAAKPYFVKMLHHFREAGLSAKDFAAAVKDALMNTFGLSEDGAKSAVQQFIGDLRSNNIPTREEAEAEIQRMEAQADEAEGAGKEPAGARPMEGQSFRSLREALSRKPTQKSSAWRHRPMKAKHPPSNPETVKELKSLVLEAFNALPEAKQRLTQAGHWAWDNVKTESPRLYRALQEAGILVEWLALAQDRYYRRKEALLEADPKMTPDAAHELVEEELRSPPEEDAEENRVTEEEDSALEAEIEAELNETPDSTES